MIPFHVVRPALRASLLVLGALSMTAPPGRAAGPAPVLPLAWGEHAGHPLQAKADSAPVLTPDLINDYRLARVPWRQIKELINPVNPAKRSAYFKGNHIPPAKLQAMLRHPTLAGYIRSMDQARNEFDRKRMEDSIQKEVVQKRIALAKTPCFALHVEVALGGYDFARKGFPVLKAGASAYRHEDFDLVETPGWPSLSPILPMSEADAERFVSENPGRRVSMLALLEPDAIETIGDAAALTEKMKAGVLFTAFLGNARDGRRPVLAALPSEAGLSRTFTVHMDGILDAMKEHRNPSSYEELLVPEKTCGSHADSGNYWRLRQTMEKAGALGFKAPATPEVEARKASLEKTFQERTAMLKGTLKTGKVYQGFQTYPNGTRRKLTIVFTKRGEGIHYGTCTYANGKKAVVWAFATECAHGPCIAFDFYTPQDDEPGHSDDFNAFHVIRKDWAVGTAMGDTVDYTSPTLPTRISLK